MSSRLKQSAKEQPATQDQPEVPHLFEQEPYKAVAAKLGQLKQRLVDSERQHVALVEERRRLSSSEPITFSSKMIEDHTEVVCSLGERISGLGERIRSLQKSLQLGEAELERIRTRVSFEMTEFCKDHYQMQARIVLHGMLEIQQGNDAIHSLREHLERNGYAAGRIVPMGVAPWPIWGHPVDPSSVWRMVLGGFLEA